MRVDVMEIKLKIFKVKRYLIEEFEVVARSRKEAMEVEKLDPNKITVIKETYHLVAEENPTRTGQKLKDDES